MHRRADAVATEVMFGEPHRVVTGLVHHVDPVECTGVDVFERNAPIAPSEELQNADLHELGNPRAPLERTRNVAWMAIDSSFGHRNTCTSFVQPSRTLSYFGLRGILEPVRTSCTTAASPGYLPNPIQAAGWLLDATDSLWAGPAPLLLPLRHWTQVAEDVAWMAGRFPGRVGAGFACGGLAQDFQMAEVPYEGNLDRFKAALPEVVKALRGKARSPLSEDAAVKACGDRPDPDAECRAAGLGIGVLYDSLQTVERTRELSQVYAQAGGTGACIAIRRVWLGPPPRAAAEEQMDFYRSYAKPETQRHWGEGQELIAAEQGAELSERLADFCHQGGLQRAQSATASQRTRAECDSHDQIAAIGADYVTGQTWVVDGGRFTGL